MPVYNPRPLGYTQFIRSTAPAPFIQYDKPDIAICWMDLLGVRQMPHAQITAAVDIALNSAAEASSNGGVTGNGILIGTPNSAVQYSLVGDALVLTEKDMPNTRAAAKLAFLYRINILSRLLNERGLLHRGVITTGEVKCLVYEGSSIITGAGVVTAANLEGNLKTAGLFYDETWVRFIQLRQQQVDNQNFVAPFSAIPNWNAGAHAPNLAGVCFTQFEGWDHWKNMVNAGVQTNNKVANAQTLIQELKNTYGSLP